MSWSKKSSSSSTFASFTPVADIKLGIRAAQCAGILISSTLAGANLSLSFFVIPRILESPPHLLLKQFNNSFRQGQVFFPVGAIISTGSYLFLAWKHANDKIKLKGYAAAGLLSIGIVPYTFLVMMYTNKKLLAKVEETQGLVYSDRDFDDEASSGTGRKHKSSKSSKERSSKSKSSSSSRKRSSREEVEEVEDLRTPHQLVDRWGVLNLGRGLMLLASGAVGAWITVRY